MKKVVQSKEMCYTDRTKMKRTIKFATICSLSVLCTAALVIATTVAVVHKNNSTGMGGFDSASITNNTSELLAVSKEISEAEGVADDLAEFLETSEAVAENTEIFEDELANFLESDTDGITDIADGNEELSYISYRVKSGDMVGKIAQTFSLTQDTIISVNNIKNTRTLSIGQYLKIPSMAGILYTVKEDGESLEEIADKYEVDLEICSQANNLPANTTLSAGKSIFIPGGQLDRFDLAEINGDMFRNPLHASAYRLTSNFGYRIDPIEGKKKSYHNGMDMACSTGTPIYAALEGRVVSAGWSNVYGNYVIIEHHSGYKTLYGHMSRITCSKGNYVYNTTKIGLVGTTGRSTGPHLHFTIYKNGTAINPKSVVPFNRK